MHSPPPQRSKLSWPTAAHGDTPSVRGHLAATLSLVMVRSLLLLAWRCITTCVATAAALLLSTHGPRPAGLRRTPSEVLRLSHLDAAPSTTEIVFVGDASCGKSELLCEALRHRPVGFAAADEAPGLEAQRVGVIVCSAVQADGFESLLPYVKRWRLALRRDFGGRVPVVLVCTKADLTPMRLPLIQALEEQGVACLTVSAKVGTNIRHLWQLFARGLPPALLSTAARRHGLLLRLQALLDLAYGALLVAAVAAAVFVQKVGLPMLVRALVPWPGAHPSPARPPPLQLASGRLPTLCERGDGFGPLALRRVLTFP
ncbi:hypothetical protein EMIHUDRAFT_203022 [Emiliania huxleyi CCMP1516]|uniref:Uncharacterized protein n=2 Tax=Emiliania huxleyi TaxID=2903 RepID=A0A0D3K5D3_EMIH1|nr:hypothetical protein EMIHUDRAFT_203022 [Emiliania huxleyi CCMP1516]EOD30968.1 hypothetical protein EMIHUDRAFT_203022 [Emiliania huxleyi CCMP1516]|eukprot:XP_005783397.1 hypothetical protein EMIHUDRAFT_203022 [Emiliania huxleyi CCMP1516]